MESPVVVDKPPEYHGNAAKNNQRGFPFDEEEGTGAWSELAARHPDIAARLRQRPATWARKRRPSSQDATDDFDDNFSGFDRFPFDDIPTEFREHFPSHWNRRYGTRDEPHQQQPPSPQPQSPQQHSTATQTEQAPGPSQDDQQSHLPQYGLRNTVDLGQKSPAHPGLVDEDDRNHRSMSAPPDNRTSGHSNINKMSGHNNQEQAHHPQTEQQSSNVRHIPIFVEGRDEPVINKSVDRGTHFGDAKPTYVPPSQPHIDRDQYFADDGPVNFHHPPNFSRTFGTPFNKGFRQGPQPFVQQKVYPQTAFARGASPQRSQSPKPQMPPEEHYVKVPVHHEQTPRAETPSRAQQKQPPRQPTPQRQSTPPQQPPPQQNAPPQQQAPPQQEAPPQPKPQPSMNDPITQILSIQTDVLNLMSEVENFTGTKKDKRYLYLDEMLTRNLIKLDTIETDGKENIRLARKEAIRCIQKCIAVLEAKAEKGSSASQHQDVEIENSTTNEQGAENGEVELKNVSNTETTTESEMEQENSESPKKEEIEEHKPKEEKVEVAPSTESKEVGQPQVADTRPEQQVKEQIPEVTADENVEKEKKSPKKGTKNVKKRDKSKDKKDATNDSIKEVNVEKKDDKSQINPVEKVEPKKDENEQNKDAKVEQGTEDKVEQKKNEKLEAMQIDGKGDSTETQTMEVDSHASQ
ncbi:unnamed protein product [Parnassius mnemosyne]|uniref:BAG domain-containing protein n=2 Tax=Parnassius mnemosyne TaxID=213953 RepID=A0AAV1LM48_9NEOP